MAQNIATKVEGDKLVITVDLKQNLGPSTSGKNTLIASTQGNMAIAGSLPGLKLGLNLYVPVARA